MIFESIKVAKDKTEPNKDGTFTPMILYNFQWNLKSFEFLEIEVKEEAKQVGHRVEPCCYYVPFTSHFVVLHFSVKSNIFYTRCRPHSLCVIKEG